MPGAAGSDICFRLRAAGYADLLCSTDNGGGIPSSPTIDRGDIFADAGREPRSNARSSLTNSAVHGWADVPSGPDDPRWLDVVPGQLIEKSWQVSNSGTCNWDERYKLTHIGGDAMGAAASLPLYPARAGAEATISIVFTAPQAAGTYESQWQAVNADGVPFGSAFYMQVAVSP